MKETLKNELNNVYDRKNLELITELDQQRQNYNEISFKYAILKKEFESLRRTAQNDEEKFQLQKETLETEFEQEKRFLTTRIEQLSNSTLADAPNFQNLQKISNLERNSARLESELKISKEIGKNFETQLKSERRSNEITVGDLQKELKLLKVVFVL